MKKGIIGKKVGMTQIFDDNGKIIPVTVIEAGPCVIAQKKTVQNDGYEAVQLGYGDTKTTKLIKPKAGHFEKSNIAPKKHLREFKFENTAELKVGDDIKSVADLNVGDEIKADIFEKGDIVDVTGTSKGKGYAGTIKRYNTSRLVESHGTGPVGRHAGSMGAGASPSRIYKGKKMPGHMGAEKVTIQNLEIAKIDVDNNLIAIKGAIPGPKHGLVIVSNSVKKG